MYEEINQDEYLTGEVYGYYRSRYNYAMQLHGEFDYSICWKVHPHYATIKSGKCPDEIHFRYLKKTPKGNFLR